MPPSGLRASGAQRVGACPTGVERRSPAKPSESQGDLPLAPTQMPLGLHLGEPLATGPQDVNLQGWHLLTAATIPSTRRSATRPR